MTSLATHPVDLEPSLVSARTYASRRRYAYLDGATLLSIQICTLDLFPANMIVPNLTYVGRPALVIGLLLWFWWVIVRLHPRLMMIGPQPMRWIIFFYLVAMMASYAAGFLRGLPQLEANGADLALLAAAEFTGVILLAADGIPNWDRLYSVLRVLVWCSAFMAVVGILQFVLGRDVSRYFVLPGLQLKGTFAGLEARGGGFSRVASTATHYIEFSTVMAMALPFAIHFARFSAARWQRQVFMGLCVLIAAAIPIALSRTGIVALLAALVVMVPAWNWRMRYNILVVSAAMLAGFMVIRPGLLGTLTSLFSGWGSDPSIEGRTQDYAVVYHYISERPWLGRGAGTFIPALYTTLDNQWLGMLVTNGVIGVAALAAVHLTAITLAGIALRRSTRPADRHLCAALISTQLIAIVVAGTFDSLGFTTFSTTLALLTGVSGAVWRFTHPKRTIRTSMVRWYGI